MCRICAGRVPSGATLQAGMLTLARLPPRLLSTHFSQSASDQKCRQWKPIQPLRTSTVAVSRAGSLQVHERGIQKTLPFRAGRQRAPSCLWLPFIGMKRARQEGQGFRTNEKTAKIHCSTSKQKLSEFKLKWFSPISFSLVIYYSEENEKAFSCSGLNITLKLSSKKYKLWIQQVFQANKQQLANTWERVAY